MSLRLVLEIKELCVQSGNITLTTRKVGGSRGPLMTNSPLIVAGDHGVEPYGSAGHHDRQTQPAQPETGKGELQGD